MESDRGISWHYLEAGQQFGPVSDAQFQELLRLGRLTSQSWVWREGMASWQPLAMVMTAAVPAAHETAGWSFCSQCGKAHSFEDMIRFRGQWICAACKNPFFQRLREAGGMAFSAVAVAAGGVRYGGFWLRFAAILLDSLIIGVLDQILGFVIGVIGAGAAPSGRHSGRSDETGIMIALMVGFVTMVVNCMYEMLFLGRFGATPGKMACGLRVIRRDGQAISYSRAFARYWARLLSYMTLYIGFIIAAFDREKAALHDSICNTRVIRK